MVFKHIFERFINFNSINIIIRGKIGGEKARGITL